MGLASAEPRFFAWDYDQNNAHYKNPTILASLPCSFGGTQHKLCGAHSKNNPANAGSQNQRHFHRGGCL